LFQHADFVTKVDQGKEVSRKRLVNVLNHLNFQGNAVLVNFQHPTYGNVISMPAKPLPCLDHTFDCEWVQKTDFVDRLQSYKFLNVLLDKDLKVILVKTEVRHITRDGISLVLPEKCYEVSSRRARRHPARDIKAEIIQNGISFSGSLLDFSTCSLTLQVFSTPPHTFQWINATSPVYVLLKNGENIFYSGNCTIIRQSEGKRSRVFALEGMDGQIMRFQPEKFRSTRYKLVPQPNALFRHPLTGRMVNLEVNDMSYTGLSVEEYQDSSVLFPGLIIPELLLEVASDLIIRCKTQVVHKESVQSTGGRACVRYGLSILDMDVQDQMRHSALLRKVADRRSYVSHAVDVDALWEFFFEAGFLYPAKYASIFSSKDRFRATYEKLYIQSPSIARHFIYQDKGVIQGHMSMIHFYENTWLIHHHAALRQSLAGLAVLNEVSAYINDYHTLYSTHMDFLICYFRPENRFPNRVFGGFTRQLQDPKGSSIDAFAYFHLSGSPDYVNLPEPWSLVRTEQADLHELKSFYEYQSGGLMISALDLEPDTIYSDLLNQEFQALGFTRARHLFSLKKENNLVALLMVTLSDTGLNLSNLTNCIHAIVVDGDNLPPEVLDSQLKRLLSYYNEDDEVPILLHPVAYADRQSIGYEKTYNLWVINTRVGDQYLDYMKALLPA
jgi:hypothetical protein